MAMSKVASVSQPTSTSTEKTPSASVSSAPDEKDPFFWTYTEEPHRTRRQAIIKAHPEVLKLCGPEPLTKWLVLAVVLLQVGMAYLLRHTAILSWTFLLTTYVIGATANQNLFLAIHEISHNLAFKSATANRLLAVFANLPIAVPYSAAFRPYHLTHHKALGVDGLDADLPTVAEAMVLDSVLGKAFFCTFQILFYAIRPMMIYRIPISRIHIFNIVVQIGFDIGLVRATGQMTPLVYLLLSSFLAGSLHPCAGHFIAEHYLLKTSSSPSPGRRRGGQSLGEHQHQRQHQDQENKTQQETFSYYGPLNLLTYQVGLHNEHHDFPAIPWTRLPTLHHIAADFYTPLACHHSWVAVIWNFIWDADVGLNCRLKRRRQSIRQDQHHPQELET